MTKTAKKYANAQRHEDVQKKYFIDKLAFYLHAYNALNQI